MWLAPHAAQANLKVFACFPEWEALVKELGGDRVEVFRAVGPLTNPDYVDVTPALIAALRNADLLVCTGNDFEGEWLPGALDRAQNPKLRQGQPGIFFAADFIVALETHPHEGREKEGGHLHQQGNPHIQGDPGRIRAIAGRLGRRLIDLDPANAAVYRANTKAFIVNLGNVIKELEEKAAALRGVNIVAQHAHPVHFLKWLKVITVAIVEPEIGVPPGSADLANIIDRVPRDNVKFIIHAAYEDPRPSKLVAERANIPLISLPITVGGTDDARTYADFYRSSVARMLDGLAGRDRP